MTRPRKQTVDYFPHSCNHGETMFIIEQRFGNDGYAFWFKLLELLGKTEGHFLDCRKPSTWNYLAAKTLVDKEKAEEILGLLSELEAIDTELWTKNKIVWSDNFLKGLAFAYRNRGVSIPNKPVICVQESGICGTTNDRNPQMKVNEMKVNKKDLADSPPANGRDFAREFDQIFYPAYPNKKKPAYAKQAYVAKGKKGRLPPVEDLVAALREQETSEDWIKDGGRFIPHPSSWINGEQWLNKPPEPKRQMARF